MREVLMVAAMASAAALLVAALFVAGTWALLRCERRMAHRIAELVEQRLQRRPPEPPGRGGLCVVRRVA